MTERLFYRENALKTKEKRAILPALIFKKKILKKS